MWRVNICKFQMKIYNYDTNRKPRRKWPSAISRMEEISSKIHTNFIAIYMYIDIPTIQMLINLTEMLIIMGKRDMVYIRVINHFSRLSLISRRQLLKCSCSHSDRRSTLTCPCDLAVTRVENQVDQWLNSDLLRYLILHEN